MSFAVRRRLADVLKRAGAQPRECAACAASRRSFLALAAAGAMGGLAAPLRVSYAHGKPAGGRVVDFHTHMCDRDLLARKGQALVRTPDRLLNPAAHIADMDRTGVDVHVVTMSNAIQGISWGNAREDLEIHRRINDEIAEKWVGAFPGRFIGACSLPCSTRFV